MSIWIIWLIIAALLAIVEILSQSIWTLCLAVGCICAAISDSVGIPLVWQIAIMALGAVLAFPALLPLFRKWHHPKKGAPDTRTGMDALLGRRGIVVDEIRPGQLGRVRIDGDRWQAKVPHSDRVIPRGAEVVVNAYDSIILTVEPISTSL
ncbi:MAG: NfeD family protein [Muribaculum sp.]|nr:NfeD family protein [Muribaculum sp.]